MKSSEKELFDDIDYRILDCIQSVNNISNTQIAEIVNLSAPAVHTRLKKIASQGIIDKQVAILNQQRLGFDLLCYVYMSTDIHREEELRILEDQLINIDEILECHSLTGEFDYLMKIVVRDRRELAQFIRKLNKMKVTRIQTNLSLREVKSTTALPIKGEF
ncbi:Lrp/AsnC family transcriptional regulator [Peribacillus simplex]|uniref:Lrp/AsnC family transcriptional regulator n=1 Tax=Peribacillus simplex TaxID=1478 RepID=A0A8B5Y546_9BACI|nr:Lrp/AsnC family transcriptional regulator [Peribacillus simplex]MED3983508.1 Lrp/AsnC family transcriptional regulator [Peribacillus simplex]MED4096845.1 Lrp/AsnC family transcriptional regulator [Peribacillus simplex]TVX84208.1 Lrp/AsnC family transcriptional regulator [Peribacillus simplex]CAH0318544.1 DNA-binding transcriptional activator DecR [Peribacillus simplex]